MIKTEVNIMDAGNSGNPAGRSRISVYCDIVAEAFPTPSVHDR